MRSRNVFFNADVYKYIKLHLREFEYCEKVIFFLSICSERETCRHAVKHSEHLFVILMIITYT